MDCIYINTIRFFYDKRLYKVSCINVKKKGKDGGKKLYVSQGKKTVGRRRR